MDQNKYIEVRIVEPLAEVPTTDTTREYFIKTLSTIHECDSVKVCQSCVQSENSCAQRNVPHPASQKSNIRSFPSSKQKLNSDKPLDIDLLLRCYARNSDMEKSINKVLARMDDQACKDTDLAPLIELGAVCKICDSLGKDSSPLRELQLTMRRWSEKKLEEILSNDPSMKMCEHCGVISCAKPRRTSVESRKSPLTTSYFLNAQMFPDGDDDAKTYGQARKINCGKEQEKKRVGKCRNVQRNGNRLGNKERMDDGKTYGSREISLKRENNFPQCVETMVAEREHEMRSDAINREALETDKTELQNYVKSSQIKNSKGTVGATTEYQSRVETDSNFEENDKNKKDDTTVDFGGNFLYFSNPVDCEGKFVSRSKLNKCKVSLRKDQREMNSNEKVLRDILYEKPESDFADSAASNCQSLNNRERTGNKHNQSTNVVNDAAQSGNEATYLARDRVESIDRKSKESISQLDETTRVHSRYPTNRRSFLLHNKLNPELSVSDKPMSSDKIERNRVPNMASVDSQNRTKHSRHIESVRNVKQLESLTCLMEDDSLENCVEASSTLVQINESNTTLVSSSSAENMIREWVKVPQISEKTSVRNETCKSLDSKSSSVDLNCSKMSTESQQRNREDRSESSSKNQTRNHRRSKRTISSIISGSFKLWNSKDSIKDKGSEKRFRKHLFESFKSDKSVKSTKLKELSENSESLDSSNGVRNITRRIVYDESSLQNLIDNSGNKMEETLSRYRKILESTENMDWRSFRRFVENLHPGKRNVWRDICKIIDDKVKRMTDEDDGTAEICIEITSVPSRKGKEQERGPCSNEIVFEMDVTLGDVERYLSRQLPFTEKEQLDTFKRANEVIKVGNDDVCDIGVASNQAE
ncbi:hypothetical protein E2986_02527 [Frieseomelitta varia]|uniref:Uncharacterized protein n=1 Tax=Frieseomelitta varia TaxID=561572 RepID=A0A833VLF6_9HYME|nr:uncharacterized protein LOC122534570 [Frieseomelitta varia]KAF3422951.1 hypothetical protein E2986_02527 [Frieseomelitta varia]